MKNKFTLLIILLLNYVITAQTVSIGTDDIRTTGLPIDPFYKYSYTQQIYLASEINQSGTINQLIFKVAPNRELNRSNTWVVYLAHTSKTEFNDTDDWVASTELTQVYSATFAHTPGADVTLVLDVGFGYNGTDNLLIAVEENDGGYDSGSDDLLASAVTGNRAIMFRSDSIDPNPASPPTATNIQNHVANVDINFGSVCDLAKTVIDDDFESHPAGSGQPLPQCWSSIAPAGMAIGTRNTTNEANSGSNYISAYVGFASNEEAYIITPKLNSIDGSHEADFYIKNSYPGASYQLGTMSNPNDSSTFTSINSEATLPIAYTNINTGSVSATSDEYFAIKFSSPDAHSVIRIDDFKWQETVVPPPSNDTCATAIDVTNLPYSHTQDATTATNNDGFITACSNGMNDGVWYTFTPNTTQQYNINLQVTSAWDAELGIFSGDCSNLTCVERSDSGGTNGDEHIIRILDAGTPYWINVGHYSDSSDGTEGNYTITISALTVPDNDACTDAITVNALPYQHSMDATASTNNNGMVSCNANTMNDGVWYTYTTGNTAETVNITTEDGSNWDMALGVYKGTDCSALECVIQEDGSSTNFGEDIEDLSLEANTTYWINVGHASSSTDEAEGNFTIHITQSSLSTNDNSINESQFTIYPNPTKDGLVNLKLNNPTLQKAKISVYNMLGKKVFVQTIATNQQVNVSALQSGTYILKLETDDYRLTKRLIINK